MTSGFFYFVMLRMFLLYNKVVDCQNLVKNTFANLYIQVISPEIQPCGALARKLHLFVTFVLACLFFCPLITVKLILNWKAVVVISFFIFRVRESRKSFSPSVVAYHSDPSFSTQKNSSSVTNIMTVVLRIEIMFSFIIRRRFSRRRK